MSSKKSKVQFSNESYAVSEMYKVPSDKPHTLPIYATSSYEMESLEHSIDIFEGKKEGFVYSRYGNPTVQALEEKIALLEKGSLKKDVKAIMTSSGMSAISTLMIELLNSGDILVTPDGLYGGSTELLVSISKKIGFTLLYADLNDMDALNELQLKNKITAVYFETPGNPLLNCVDIKKLTGFCKKNKITSVCDNTISTPYLQQPLSIGVDYVIYSTTKYLAGHGNSIAGCIVSTHTSKMNGDILKNMRLLGTNCSPFEAWLTYIGLKTLHLRMERQCSNAIALAKFLNGHPKVNKVNHTSLSDHPFHKLAIDQMSNHAPLMSFEVKGGLKGAKKFMNALQLITHAPTLGDLDTLILHPDSSSHRNIPIHKRKEIGITPGLIRMSTGIENLNDLKADILQALDK